jgi:transcriptional regulator with XRE-family HTH domain
VKLGERIRALRLKRGLTVAELAKRAGYTPGFISQVEKDITNPSIMSIQKIASTLGAAVSTFFDDTHGKRLVVRKAERRKIVFPRSRVTDYLLSPSLSGHLQVIYTEIQPGGGSGSEPYTHESDEECVVVLRGRLRFWVGEEMHLLREGDSITFGSRMPHRWENAGRGKTAALWAITPPSY